MKFPGISRLNPFEYNFANEELFSRLYAAKVLPLGVRTVDLDFYKLGPDKEFSKGELRILYNSCMGDLYAMMVQTGRR